MKKRKMVPVARPLLGMPEVEAASRAILSGWITQGNEVAEFEKEFAAYVDAPHACAVSSCTTALHLALLALGIGFGDEVITVSHSYIATANAIVHSGATPVFVDVERDTFNLDPALIEPAITTKTRAILCVHQMGMPCEMQMIATIARKHNLALIEDAACAAGSQIEVVANGKEELWPVGNPLGDVVCFSFHPRKVLTTGDGGMLTTNNPDLDAKFRLLRQHGMSVPDTKRHTSSKVIFEDYPVVGYNYRMTDIQAAIGREQLGRMPEMISERRALAESYRELLGNLNWLTLPAEDQSKKSNWQSYCVLLDPAFNQRDFMQFLLDRNIATRRGIMCAHRERAYSTTGRTEGSLANSEFCQDHGVVLPLYSGLSLEDQVYVADTIKSFFEIQEKQSNE